MKTLQQMQDEETRELKVMLVVIPVAVLVFLYLAIGVAVTVTQRWFSPCSPYETRTFDREFEKMNALRGLVLPVILWGPRFVQHAILDDMPIRHFVFASDCQWSEQSPEPQRIFAPIAGEKTCPPGTNMIRRQRCAIPVGVWEPVQTYELPHSSDTCPQGWIRLASERIVMECRLPSLAKLASESCPRGFVVWTAPPDKPGLKTYFHGSSPLQKVEVCRLASD